MLLYVLSIDMFLGLIPFPEISLSIWSFKLPFNIPLILGFKPALICTLDSISTLLPVFSIQVIVSITWDFFILGGNFV